MRYLLKVAALLLLLMAAHGLRADLENFNCHDITAAACKKEFGRLFEQTTVDVLNSKFKEAYAALITITKDAMATNIKTPESTDFQFILEFLERRQSKLTNEPPKNLVEVEVLFLNPPFMLRSMLREDYLKTTDKAFICAADGTVDGFNALYAQMLKTKPDILETYPEFKRIHDKLEPFQTADDMKKKEIFPSVMQELVEFLDINMS